MMRYFEMPDRCFIRSPEVEVQRWIDAGGREIGEAEYEAVANPAPTHDARVESVIQGRIAATIRQAVKTGTAAGFFNAMRAMVDEEEAK